MIEALRKVGVVLAVLLGVAGIVGAAAMVDALAVALIADVL